MILLEAFWSDPSLAQIVTAVIGALVAAYGIRRAIRSDKVVEQTGARTEHAQSIGQVMGSLNGLNDRLSREVERLDGVIGAQRAEIASLKEAQRAEIASLEERLARVESGGVDLRAKNDALERENQELHAELAAAAKREEAAAKREDELTTKVATLERRIDELEKNNSTGGGTP